MREEMGALAFDEYYRNVHKFLSSLYFGQYFVIRSICRIEPEYHDVFLACCDIYYHMDYFVNMEYDPETDTVKILRPDFFLFKDTDHYWPPDVYSSLLKYPKMLGINSEDI